MVVFSVCEDRAYREQASPEWKPCSRDTMRGTIGECFLVTSADLKHTIRTVLTHVVLSVFHLNTDLWTSKVSHQKFLGVRIFWKTTEQMKTELLAVTWYAPPKVEGKQASNWLMEYVLEVMKWYGVEPRQVNHATSDAGSDCKKAFNVLVTQHGSTWFWYFPHVIHCVLVECLGTQKDRSKTTN